MALRTLVAIGTYSADENLAFATVGHNDRDSAYEGIVRLGIVTLIDRGRVSPERDDHGAVMLPSGRTSPHSRP
jgi:hypothetical protein